MFVAASGCLCSFEFVIMVTVHDFLGDLRCRGIQYVCPGDLSL